MRVMTNKGMPPRGSIQDRIVCEMLFRERKRRVSEHLFTARILAAGFGVPESIFSVWSELLSLEVFHDNYRPVIIDEKAKALKELEDRTKDAVEQNASMIQRLKDLEVTESDMRAPTQDELEEYRRKLRKRHLKTTLD